MGDPYNHDYSILGSILEYRHLGRLTYSVWKGGTDKQPQPSTPNMMRPDRLKVQIHIA